MNITLTLNLNPNCRLMQKQSPSYLEPSRHKLFFKIIKLIVLKPQIFYFNHLSQKNSRPWNLHTHTGHNLIFSLITLNHLVIAELWLYKTRKWQQSYEACLPKCLRTYLIVFLQIFFFNLQILFLSLSIHYSYCEYVPLVIKST